MRIHRAAAACTLAAGAVLAAASPAGAAPQTTYSEVKNVVVTGADGDEAIVTVKYRCLGEGFHLWASVKQGPGIDPTVPGGTSSANAEAWYETPEGPAPVCDGQNHVIRYTTEQVFGELESGRAWVQFVFFYFDAAGNEQRVAVEGQPGWGGDWVTVR